jgi:putative transposase
MYLTPYTHLEWAYQLHYYLCFRTHRRRQLVDSNRLVLTLNDLCDLFDHHVLEMKTRPSDVELLLSLRPDHAISDVMKKLKKESSGILCKAWQIEPPLWARGYLARTTGKVRMTAVAGYLEAQSKHHGYDIRALPPVFRFRNPTPTDLSVAHAVFDLQYHLVLATRYRRGVFDSTLGEALVKYWLTVAHKREFAIDRATVLPDHVHMLVRTKPQMSIEQCALLLMNNGQYFVGERWPTRLIEAKVDQLWQPSAYVGSCGELPTALLKTFLRS